MDKVIVRIPKGGSLEVEGLTVEPKSVYDFIKKALEGETSEDFKVREIKRGPKKKVQQ